MSKLRSESSWAGVAGAAAVMTAYHVAARSSRDALFLSRFDLSWLPWMSAIAAALSIIAALEAGRRMQATGPSRWIPMAFGASAVCKGLDVSTPKGKRSVPYYVDGVFIDIPRTLIPLRRSRRVERLPSRADRDTMERKLINPFSRSLLNRAENWLLAAALADSATPARA